MNISLIAAVDNNGLIGACNRLPWHIPEDLKRFKSATQGCTIIMGRLTWESLPRKPLTARRNIVVSSNIDFMAARNDLNVDDAYDLDDALFICGQQEKIFIIGGQRLFEEGIKLADTVYLTRIDTSVPTDKTARYFPTEYLVENFTHTETTGTAIGCIDGNPISCEFQTWTKNETV